MITAAEAREMSGPGVVEYVASLDEKIRKAAAEKRQFVIIRDEPFARWLYPNKPTEGVAYEVISRLEQAGFAVSLHYKELQLVDLGLRIDWGSDEG